MFIHVVFYRVEDPDKNVPEMKKRLLSLPAKIGVIKKMRFGRDEIKSPRSVDACLYVEFDSKADYLTYKDHPDHLAVAAFIGSIKKESYSADYEWEGV